MKMIDLLAATTLAFLCAVLSFKLANDIAGMHADALHRLQADRSRKNPAGIS